MSEEFFEQWGLDRITNKPFVSIWNASTKKFERTYDLSAKGYTQTMTFRGIFGIQKFFEPVKGKPTMLKTIEAYVYRVYKVRAKICPECEKTEENQDYLIKMSPKTGIYKTCFRTHITVQYMDTDSKSWELVSEQPMNLSEVIEAFDKGEIDYCSDFVADNSLGKILEEHAKDDFSEVKRECQHSQFQP